MTKTGKAMVVAFALCGGVSLFGSGGCSDSNSNANDAGIYTGGAGGGNPGGTGGAGGVAPHVAVHLTGPAEVPPTTSTGTADVTVTWDPATMAVSISGSFDGLSANATAAHLHGPASPTEMAGVLFPLNIPGPPAASGTLSGSGTLNAANWTAFLGGLTYVNIHTTLNPNGEIRGQVVPQ